MKPLKQQLQENKHGKWNAIKILRRPSHFDHNNGVLVCASMFEGDVQRMLIESQKCTRNLFMELTFKSRCCFESQFDEARAARWDAWFSILKLDGSCEVPRLSIPTYPSGDSCNVGSWFGLSGFQQVESRCKALAVWNHRKLGTDNPSPCWVVTMAGGVYLPSARGYVFFWASQLRATRMMSPPWRPKMHFKVRNQPNQRGTTGHLWRTL